MKGIFIMLSTVLILASGCKAGKDYNRPDLAIPEAYNISIKDTITDLNDNRSPINDSILYTSIKWREFFQDSVLTSLIDKALANNFDIRRSIKNIEIASQQYKRAGANFFPTVDSRPAEFVKEYYSENYYSSAASSYYDQQGTAPPKSFYVQQQEFISTISTSWEIDIWGKFRRNREAEGAEFLESQEFKKAVQTSLIAEIARNYYNLLMLSAQIGVARKNLELTDNTLKIVKLQYSAGETTALAIQQTEAQKLLAASLIPQIEREYAITENRINSLLGRYPQKIEIGTSLENSNPHQVYSTGVPLELIRNRPDVAASEYALISANARVGVAMAMRYPSLNIGGALGLNSMNLDNFFSPVGSGFGLVTGSILQPIFLNRRLKTNFKIAELEREKAGLDFRENVMDAVTDVANATIRLNKLEEQYNITKEQVAVTQKGVKNASLLFRSGMATYLEVITAQSTALDTELNLINIKMQLLNADVDLYRALGGGWQ